MQQSSYKSLVISAAVMVAIILGYTGWWFAFALGVRSGIEDWAERQRGKGWTVSLDDMVLRGYPFALRLTLKDPHIVAPGRFAWDGADVLATVSPLAPTAIHLRANGQHDLTLPALDKRPMRIEAGTARATVDLGGDGPDAVSAMLQSVTVTQGRDQTTLDGLQLQLERMTPPTSRSFEAVPNAFAFALSVQKLALPAQAVKPLGAQVDNMVLRGRVRGQWETGSTRALVQSWRDSGGVLELDDLRLDWAPLVLAGNGTLALDDDLQPVVAMSARLSGFFEMVDQLVEMGAIRGRDASMAKLVLGALAKQPGDGRPPVLDIPLTIQDSVLRVGPAALGKIPTIDWPGAPLPPIGPRPTPARTPDMLKPGMTIGPQGEVVR